MLANKKWTIMHHMTALDASKKNGTNCQFEIFYAWAVIAVIVTIHQNHFAGMALFLEGEDKVGYFLDRPHILKWHRN